jgi:hypothetical protein
LVYLKLQPYIRSSVARRTTLTLNIRTFFVFHQKNRNGKYLGRPTSETLFRRPIGRSSRFHSPPSSRQKHSDGQTPLSARLLPLPPQTLAGLRAPSAPNPRRSPPRAAKNFPRHSILVEATPGRQGTHPGQEIKTGKNRPFRPKPSPVAAKNSPVAPSWLKRRRGDREIKTGQEPRAQVRRCRGSRAGSAAAPSTSSSALCTFCRACSPLGARGRTAWRHSWRGDTGWTTRSLHGTLSSGEQWHRPPVPSTRSSANSSSARAP